MNRFINIGILLLLVLFISFRVNVACNELMSDKPLQEVIPFKTPVIFSGILHCNACVGIDYTLTLESDKYFENNLYIDDDMGLIEIEGTWDFRSDTLFLYVEESQEYKRYLWEGNELILLNSHGSRREGILSTRDGKKNERSL